MDLPTVKYTKPRGGTYHFNIPIPAKIQRLYLSKNGKAKPIYDGTMRTSDQNTAENMVSDKRAEFRRQVRLAEHKAEQDRIAETLAPADARLLTELGGVEGLLKMVKDMRASAAFTLAGMGADYPAPGEIEVDGGHTPQPMALGGDGTGGQVAIGQYVSPARVEGEEEHTQPQTPTQRLERDLDRVEVQARIDRLTAETRRLIAIAAELGEQVSPSPIGVNEGVTGIRELASLYTEAMGHTVQYCEQVNNSIRRWTEFHGDVVPKKWTLANLSEFDRALRKLPSSGRADVRNLPMRDAITKGEAEGLDPIEYKTRKRYSDHMKAITKYALHGAGLLDADPFAGFQPVKEKVKHSKAKESDVIAYTPAQVGKILDHCEQKFDRQAMDFWLPLIAAYTGARREEIGQLTVDNIRVVGNMHIIDITDLDPDQKIKNQHSLRSIPIPLLVSKAGFIEYVQERRAAGAKYLFRRNLTDNRTKEKALVELSPDKRGRFTENYGRNFPRNVREPLGLTEKGMVFHSLRHSWTDAARRAKVDPELRRKIAGRMENEDAVEGGYGTDELLADKLAALEEIAKEVRT